MPRDGMRFRIMRKGPALDRVKDADAFILYISRNVHLTYMSAGDYIPRHPRSL